MGKKKSILFGDNQHELRVQKYSEFKEKQNQKTVC